MNNDNFFVIQGWMINDLKLSGNELLVYSIIYGFSQIEEQKFTGSLSYLMECTNSSKPTVLKAISSLINKNLINKEELYLNGVKYCSYKVNKIYSRETLPVVKNLNWGSKESLLGGSKETLPNNINNKNINNNIDNIDIYKSKRFIKPTIEEINNYCKERNNNINAEQFYNYYESKGWLVGKAPMRDWKCAVRTWELNNFSPYVSKTHKKDDSYMNPDPFENLPIVKVDDMFDVKPKNKNDLSYMNPDPVQELRVGTLEDL